MRKCPYCGTGVENEQTVCPKCRAEIPAEKPKAKKPKEKE